MANEKEIYLTTEGMEELKKELDNLIQVKRPEVILALKEARALGDLSENAEYDAARSEQAEVEARIKEIERKYEVDNRQVYSWYKKYKEKGLEGLISKTGANSKSHKNMGLHFRKPKNKIEELELEIMKKDIEIARLKKGYNVKGVGQEKEFVTIFNKNIK